MGMLPIRLTVYGDKNHTYLIIKRKEIKYDRDQFSISLSNLKKSDWERFEN